MHEGKVREAWNHTSSIMALIFNVNRDGRKCRPIKAADVHPYLAKRRCGGIPITAGNLKVLKRVFVAQKGNQHGR